MTDATDEKRKQRAPIELEPDIRAVCDDIVTGKVALEEGHHATPHFISVIIGDLRGGKDNRPSSGAIQAALKRWEEVGYITCHQKPFAFDDYTEEGRTLGLSKLKEQFTERKKAARAAEKAAEPASGNGETASTEATPASAAPADAPF